MVEPSRGVTEIYSPFDTGKSMIPIYHVCKKQIKRKGGEIEN